MFCMSIIVLWFACMRSLHDLLVLDFACSCVAHHFDSSFLLLTRSSVFGVQFFSGIKFDSDRLPFSAGTEPWKKMHKDE